MIALFMWATAGVLTAWLICKAVQIAFRFVGIILRRLARSMDRAADLAGEAAANAIARQVEQALDQADRVVARGTEWRTLRKTWRREFRASMSWSQFKAQMVGQTAGDKLTEAISLFGLAHPFTRADLDRRFKKTMFAVHPDQGGSDYLARLTTEARALILKHKGWRK
jgi:hypothetical protein